MQAVHIVLSYGKTSCITCFTEEGEQLLVEIIRRFLRNEMAALGDRAAPHVVGAKLERCQWGGAATPTMRVADRSTKG